MASLSPLAHLFPNLFLLSDSPQFVTISLIAGAFLSLLLIFGKYDRIAAVVLWYFWACLYGRNPLIGNPSLPFIGWLLLAYALLPSAGNNSPAPMDGGKYNPRQLPEDIFAAAWILMSIAYFYSGYTKLVSPSWVDGSALSHVLANPLARDTALRTFLLGLPAWVLKAFTWSALALELCFAPLALFRRVRPFLWSAMVGLHLGLLFLVNFSDLTAGMLLVHFFTFDPAWIRAPQPAGETIFFDGHCGVCHGFVRFVLGEDISARPFSFAPLQGEFIRRKISKPVRAMLADSMAVIDGQGNILSRSLAVIYVMKRLGGLWWILAGFLKIVPKAVSDFAYDVFALVRLAIRGTTQETCPLVPPSWRVRFRD